MTAHRLRELGSCDASALRCVASDLMSIVEDIDAVNASLYVNIEDGVPYWEVIVHNGDGTYSTHHEFPGRDEDAN